MNPYIRGGHRGARGRGRGHGGIPLGSPPVSVSGHQSRENPGQGDPEGSLSLSQPLFSYSHRDRDRTQMGGRDGNDMYPNCYRSRGRGNRERWRNNGQDKETSSKNDALSMGLGGTGGGHFAGSSLSTRAKDLASSVGGLSLSEQVVKTLEAFSKMADLPKYNIVAFLNEFKAVECVCCDNVLGFQHRESRVVFCSPECGGKNGKTEKPLEEPRQNRENGCPVPSGVDASELSSNVQADSGPSTSSSIIGSDSYLQYDVESMNNPSSSSMVDGEDGGPPNPACVIEARKTPSSSTVGSDKEEAFYTTRNETASPRMTEAEMIAELAINASPPVPSTTEADLIAETIALNASSAPVPTMEASVPKPFDASAPEPLDTSVPKPLESSVPKPLDAAVPQTSSGPKLLDASRLRIKNPFAKKLPTSLTPG